jgi:hypothetical protein
LPNAWALGPIEVEIGAQVDSFRESFGAGDLFSDLDDPLSVSDDPLTPIDTRLTSEETLPGGYASISWIGTGFLARHAKLHYRQDSKDAEGSFAGAYACSLGSRWTLGAGESLRLLHPTGEDSTLGRTVTHEFGVEATHQASPRVSWSLAFREELARTSGDTIFDYDLLGVSTGLVRRLGAQSLRGKVEWSHRAAIGGFFSDRDRWVARVGLDRYGASGVSYAVDLRGTRVDYAANGEVSPSGREGELSVYLSRALRESWSASAPRVELDGRGLLVAYDDPDSTYASYSLIESEARVYGPWSLPSIGLGAGGEWVRPHDGEDGAYDQTNGTMHVSLMTLTGFWVDVETSVGFRDYLGGARELGTGGTAGLLDLDSSDFWYVELSFLVSLTWRSFLLEASAQSTTENHEIEEDDADYVLVNARAGVRF